MYETTAPPGLAGGDLLFGLRGVLAIEVDARDGVRRTSPDCASFDQVEVGRSFLDAADASALRSALVAARREPGVPSDAEVRMHDGEGRERHVRWSLTGVETGAVVGVGTDVTDTHRLADLAEREAVEQEVGAAHVDFERHMGARTAELDRAHEEIDAFAYSVSHDLRAPLRSIDGFTRILVEEHAEGLDDEARALLERVRQAAQRMGRLIDDLLRFSRTSRRSLERHRVDMRDLVVQVLDDLDPQADGRSVDVEVSELPEALGDQGLLRQVVANLVDNAFKYTQHVEGPRVEIGWDPERRAYSVADNGVGFDMAYVHKLFGVFQRLHGHAYEGTGIGLATVQRIVHMHGGEVWAASEPDGGATFCFTVPDPEEHP